MNNIKQQQLGLIAQYVEKCSLQHHIESSMDLRDLKDHPTPQDKVSVNVKKLDSHSESRELYKITIDINYIFSAGLKKLFTIDLSMIGEFIIEGIAKDDHFEKLLHIQCPTMLLPFINERLSEIVNKFTILSRPLLPNVNFEQIYMKSFK